MTQRHRLRPLLLFFAGMALMVVQPSPPGAAGQESDRQRGERGDDDSQPEGGERRGRRRFGRGEGGGGWRRDRGGEEGRNRDREERPRSEGSDGDSSGPNMESYARSLVKQNDKNGDMILNADEQSGLRNRAAASDLNKDGSITVDELVAGLSGRPSSGTASSTGSGNGGEKKPSPATGKDGKAMATRVYTALTGRGVEKPAADARRTFRFTTAKDRLPKTGLPSWFGSRDRNGDGQVAMSEYSRTWSERTVNEFGRYDLNGDGIVTVREATGK